uniref:hypothetical protein n=1 Tax=Streptomyces sp. bgisy082 TaxID=3413776 RepID=UPI003D736EE1
MGTNARGLTEWPSKKFVSGPSRWRGGNHYVQVPSPSPDNAVSAMRHGIGGNAKPIAAYTVEFARGRHYGNHLDPLTISHWISAYGYRTGGQYGKWVAPVASVRPDVCKSLKCNTRDFTVTFLQSNGYAYQHARQPDAAHRPRARRADRLHQPGARGDILGRAHRPYGVVPGPIPLSDAVRDSEETRVLPRGPHPGFHIGAVGQAHRPGPHRRLRTRRPSRVRRRGVEGIAPGNPDRKFIEVADSNARWLCPDT